MNIAVAAANLEPNFSFMSTNVSEHQFDLRFVVKCSADYVQFTCAQTFLSKYTLAYLFSLNVFSSVQHVKAQQSYGLFPAANTKSRWKSLVSVWFLVCDHSSISLSYKWIVLHLRLFCTSHQLICD